MKRTVAILLALAMLLALPGFAAADQSKSVSIYTCYVENEALQIRIEELEQELKTLTSLYEDDCTR